MNDYFRPSGAASREPSVRISSTGFCHLLWICMIVLAPVSLRAAAKPEQAWQRGNAFYQQQQYDSAAYYFEQIAAKKPAEATVFYNLGNAYYRLNRIAPAVLNYQRALKRRPDYKEAAENLLLTQHRIPGNIIPAQDIFFVRWWKAATAPGLITLWSVLSLVFFAVMIGLLLYRRLQKGRPSARPQLAGAACILWLLTLFLTLCAARSALHSTSAVIMQDTSLQPGPGGNAGSRTQLPEGVTVQVENRSGGWLQIALPDGRTGWVPGSAVTIID